MHLISDTILSYLPNKRKQTPSGWISFNAVCCNDQRLRGGLIQSGSDVSYHCFNCGFKASWKPGRTIGLKLKKLFEYLRIPNELISKMTIEALRNRDLEQYEVKSIIPKFETKPLPDNAIPIVDLINNPPNELVDILEYILSRGLDLDDYNFHWTESNGLSNRLIIPYYYKGNIVGYTARSCNQAKPKYIASQQPGYVFNLDAQNNNRQFVIVCEGQIDAISIGGISINGSEINQAQHLLINQLQREVIVVPDRDQASKKLINSALSYNYSLSFPPWDDDIKDINDATRKYGKLQTLIMILESVYTNEVKIKLKEKEWIKY